MTVASHHVESLDVFRGITIAAMILVNNPGDWGSVFPPLLHAYWTGCTFADLVFPWFIFIMGLAMPYAFARRRQSGATRAVLHGRIARRVLWLIALGLVLNAVAAWPETLPLRLPGVLQRIALSYLIASLVVLHLGVVGWAATAALLLLGHWALLVVPFDGHPAGTLMPDHNVARYVDALVFGHHATATTLDPEGLLGVLPSAATAIIGALTGDLLRRTRTDSGRLAALAVVGVFALTLGIAWSRVLPVSKPLWTGSYVAVVTGLAILAFAILYWVIDALGVRAWSRPFLWLGVNPLAIYFMSELVGHVLEYPLVHGTSGRTTPKGWVMWGLLEPRLQPLRAEWASLAFAVAFVATWIAVAGLLYQSRIRIQV